MRERRNFNGQPLKEWERRWEDWCKNPDWSQIWLVVLCVLIFLWGYAGIKP